MKNYQTQSFVITAGEVPFTIKLISKKNNEEASTIHIITLKAKLNSYLANISESSPKVLTIKNVFEKFLQPLLEQKRLIAAAINGGGDMQVGVAEGQKFIWNIAIEDPQDRSHNIYTYHLQNGAIATENSLQYEHESIPDNIPPLQQATIVASNLIQADTLASTAIAMGEQQFTLMSQHQDIHGVLINQKNTMTVLE